VDDDLRRRLGATVGAGGVDGDGVVRPTNLAQLREVLMACEASGASAAPATFPRPAADVLVDVDRLDGVRLDAAALLLHAGGGTPWAAIREATSAQRFAVTGLPMTRSDTAGESVAHGEIAHRTLAGVHLLTPAGRLISAGGRTLKDVVGYDLPGIALGSGIRLGLIAAVTLRLEPAGARTAVEPGPGLWRGDAEIDLAAAFAR